MKNVLIPAALVVAALSAPTFAFAQDNAGVSRGQVRAEQAELVQAGYSAVGDNAQYPSNVLVAEGRVARQQSVTQSYGSSSAGSSYAGSRVAAGSSDWHAVTKP